jgi:CRP/FNR family transcriptional regulator, anaerobic regulatory protein
MDSQQTTFVDGSRTTLPRQSTASPAPDETEAARFVETICAEGDWLYLRPQQRVPLPPAGKVIVLREGMLAIDAMPATGKLQVLDFLVAGDVVSASTVLPAPGVSLRAITSASLVSLDPPAVNRAVSAHEYFTFLIAQAMNQMARVNIHQLMIGRLETEARVASFILGLALRNAGKDTSEISVTLPMSRTDIANYLVINCDTLSRTMMRFCDCGLIERESRHAIRVIDLAGLRKKSPLASLLSTVFEERNRRQQMDVGGYAGRNASRPLVHENEGRGVLPLVARAGPISLSNAKYQCASRGSW